MLNDPTEYARQALEVFEGDVTCTVYAVQAQLLDPDFTEAVLKELEEPAI